jgi:hypothetical protein
MFAIPLYKLASFCLRTGVFRITDVRFTEARYDRIGLLYAGTCVRSTMDGTVSGVIVVVTTTEGSMCVCSAVVAKRISGEVAVGSELVSLECIAEALDCSVACATYFHSISINLDPRVLSVTYHCGSYSVFPRHCNGNWNRIRSYNLSS